MTKKLLSVVAVLFMAQVMLLAIVGFAPGFGSPPHQGLSMTLLSLTVIVGIAIALLGIVVLCGKDLTQIPGASALVVLGTIGIVAAMATQEMVMRASDTPFTSLLVRFRTEFVATLLLLLFLQGAIKFTQVGLELARTKKNGG